MTIGGDGSLAIAQQLHEFGIPVVGVPKTIDNDVGGTQLTFGFLSAVDCVTDAIDRLHTTAESHERIMIVEVSARKAIDFSQSSDPMRYTNHSCRPNARLCIRQGRVEFYALRAIAAGEEITVNYGPTHHEGKLACRCGAPAWSAWAWTTGSACARRVEVACCASSTTASVW